MDMDTYTYSDKNIENGMDGYNPKSWYQLPLDIESRNGTEWESVWLKEIILSIMF